MSKVKSPQAKKQLSLTHDCRNTYGENAKASRRNIPLAKARSIRAERRRVGQALSESLTDADPADAECKARDVGASMGKWGFVKSPDAPLGEVIVKKQARLRGHAAPESNPVD